MIPERVSRYFACAREREEIRLRREAGVAWPWTEDPVFRNYRFCNVFREDDKTTAWFRDKVRQHLDGWEVVEATLAFRWFNKIETGELVYQQLMQGWDSAAARRCLKGVSPVVTGAYVIKTPDGMNKLEGVLWCIDNAIQKLKPLYTRWGASLEQCHQDLLTVEYLGGFMAYEIVTDLRWTPVLQYAEDVLVWANVGPGAGRGLGYLIGSPEKWAAHLMVRPSANRAELVARMRDLLALSATQWPWHATKPWEMREVEHWLCEYAKYEGALAGDRLKRRYEPPQKAQPTLF